MTGMPSAEPGPERLPGHPDDGRQDPAALGMPNPDVKRHPRSRKTGRPVGNIDPFQTEWLDACKGKSNNVTHGTSSKTHCDFDYSGTMIEQMLLGLVAHRVGKRSSSTIPPPAASPTLPKPTTI
jgi:hypothetical protein